MRQSITTARWDLQLRTLVGQCACSCRRDGTGRSPRADVLPQSPPREPKNALPYFPGDAMGGSSRLLGPAVLWSASRTPGKHPRHCRSGCSRISGTARGDTARNGESDRGRRRGLDSLTTWRTGARGEVVLRYNPIQQSDRGTPHPGGARTTGWGRPFAAQVRGGAGPGQSPTNAKEGRSREAAASKQRGRPRDSPQSSEAPAPCEAARCIRFDILCAPSAPGDEDDEPSQCRVVWPGSLPPVSGLENSEVAMEQLMPHGRSTPCPAQLKQPYPGGEASGQQ